MKRFILHNICNQKRFEYEIALESVLGWNTSGISTVMTICAPPWMMKETSKLEGSQQRPFL
jgi:hypothetical protein